jgi:hypothetical protein
MRRGVEVTADQREELAKVVDQMQRAKDVAGTTFRQG